MRAIWFSELGAVPSALAELRTRPDLAVGGRHVPREDTARRVDQNSHHEANLQLICQDQDLQY
jgi:hypothetical protein